MENMVYCQSCSKPLAPEEIQLTQGKFCQFCSDDRGKLKDSHEVAQGIAMWLESWSPKKEGADFMERARLYMKAMPAWA